MTFDLARSVALKLYNRSKLVNSTWWKILDIICYLYFVVWVGIALFGGVSYIGLLSLMLAIALFWLWIGKFLRFQASATPQKSNNLADSLAPDAIEYLLNSQNLSLTKMNGRFDAGTLWLSLNESQTGRYFLVRAGLTTPEMYKAKLAAYWNDTPASGNWPQELIQAITDLSKSNSGMISAADIMSQLCARFPLWKEILQTQKLNEKDAQAIFSWYKKHEQLSVKKSFWEKETMEGAIGRDWSYGYTPALQFYARDLSSAVAEARSIKIYGRENEVKELEQVLSKSDANNALLIGPKGIGKSTIVRALGQRIINGKVGPTLQHRHIWELDTGRLLAGAGEKGEVEARLKKVLDEAVTAGGIILFIENIHVLLSRREKTGSVDASAILLPYLKGSGLQIIGDTNIESYHIDIEANSSVASSFDRIDIKEPKQEDVIYVLEDTIPMYEYKYGVIFTYPAVKEIVRAADRYIHDKPFPAKAIELIDNVSVQASQRGSKLIDPKLVDEVVSVKTDVPVGEATKTEKERLLSLESILHKRVIGQDEAVKAVTSALRRARAGLRNEQKPIGTFLFIGPTGVGKTETAKALAESYFGSEKKIIRLDMSEYQGADAVSKLIGAPPAPGEQGSQGVLTKAIKDNPFTVVLLDEIEKANPNVLNLFLQVLDEGRLTDGMGRTVDFTNSIIIATSNAGAELIRQSLQNNVPYDDLRKQLLDYLQKNNIFRPEFLNRFDAVVAYRPLTLQELIKIVDIMVARVAAKLAPKNIRLVVTPAAKQKLAQLGYDPVYGARPLARTIQDKLEDPLSEKLLRDEIPEGSTVTVDEGDIN